MLSQHSCPTGLVGRWARGLAGLWAGWVGGRMGWWVGGPVGPWAGGRVGWRDGGPLGRWTGWPVGWWVGGQIVSSAPKTNSALRFLDGAMAKGGFRGGDTISYSATQGGNSSDSATRVATRIGLAQRDGKSQSPEGTTSYSAAILVRARRVKNGSSHWACSARWHEPKWKHTSKIF